MMKIDQQTRENGVFMLFWDVKEKFNKSLLKLYWGILPVKGVEK